MISVCMATYNGERFIKKQLDSILLQLSENDEIIISDDGSTDRTLEIIKSFHDKRIKIFCHEKEDNKKYPNMPYSTIMLNFENALSKASGEYIFLSDQDDIWNNNKVNKSIMLLQKYDLVVSDFSLINENDDLINPAYYKKNPIRKTLIGKIITPPFLGCAMAFTKKIKEKALPMPHGVCIHDLWIGLVACKFGKVYYDFDTLFRHRISNYNNSNFTKKSTTSLFFKIKYRYFNFIEYMKLK